MEYVQYVLKVNESLDDLRMTYYMSFLCTVAGSEMVSALFKRGIIVSQLFLTMAHLAFLKILTVKEHVYLLHHNLVHKAPIRRMCCFIPFTRNNPH